MTRDDSGRMHAVFDVWHAAGRKAAVASIGPFVETSRHRLNGNRRKRVARSLYGRLRRHPLRHPGGERRAAPCAHKRWASSRPMPGRTSPAPGRPDRRGICFLSAARSKDSEGQTQRCPTSSARSAASRLARGPTSTRSGSPSTTTPMPWTCPSLTGDSGSALVRLFRGACRTLTSNCLLETTFETPVSRGSERCRPPSDHDHRRPVRPGQRVRLPRQPAGGRHGCNAQVINAMGMIPEAVAMWGRETVES